MNSAPCRFEVEDFVKHVRYSANPSSNPQGTKGNSFVTENPYSLTADSSTLGVIHQKNKTNLKQERKFL